MSPDIFFPSQVVARRRLGMSSNIFLQAKPVAKNLAFARQVSVFYLASSALLAECLVSYLSVKALRAEGLVSYLNIAALRAQRNRS
jgi:hypothetical protein